MPSLRRCVKFTVKGAVSFAPGVKIVSTVKVTNPTSEPLELPSGTYKNEEVTLPCEREPEGACANMCTIC